MGWGGGNCQPRILCLAKHIYKLHDIEFSSDFLDMALKTQATKAKIDRWDYIKLENFCTAKETQSRKATQNGRK